MLKDVITGMLNGTYDNTVNGKCSNCGGCCSNLLPVTKEEIKIIKAYIKKRYIKPIQYNDMTCPFRNNEENKCNIYSVRPYICSCFQCDKPKKEGLMGRPDNRYKTVLLSEVIK